MSLYIMRHGRTDWNNLKKLQGRTDIPLNDEGRQMADDARTEYKDVHFDVCYCSPLVRARETAQILLRDREIPIIIDNRLIEMSFGVFEGVEKAYENRDCQMFAFFTDPEHYIAPEGGESFEELFARTGNFLKEVVEPDLTAGKDVLIVGHGAMNSSIICQVKNIPLAQFWEAGIENCKLKQLR
ncbi:histidine phosphatase family protein [uncultured Treponema sp.]|uniref:histidine phosphatase family protein n=1 Tax=uncultured Treponema sp. TaxID=162155 RepID=UPI0025EE6F16|nr:histidine phosphatase family protein [uncultured Treponema sp.]